MRDTALTPSPLATQILGRLVIVLIYVFLLAPIVVVFFISFDPRSYLGFPPEGFTFDWYRSVFQNSDFVRGFQVSLLVAAIVAAITTSVGVPVAIAISRTRSRWSGALGGLFLSPLLVPTVVLGLALMLVLLPMGFVGTYPGLIIAHSGICVPYVVRTTLTSLATREAACEEAAATLGARPLVVFWRITLPLILPGVIAGTVFSFLMSFDEAVISLFVVGTKLTTLPVEIFHYVEFQATPELAALSVLLIGGSILIVLLIERSVGLRRALA